MSIIFILYLSVVLCWYLAYKCQKLSFYVYFLCIFLLFPRKNSNTRMYDVLYQKYTYIFFGRMTSIWQPIKHKKNAQNIFFALSFFAVLLLFRLVYTTYTSAHAI